MNLSHQARGVFRLPRLDDQQTWVSYGALAAVHYDVDADSPYWHEPPGQKFTFDPFTVTVKTDAAWVEWMAEEVLDE